MQMPMHVSCRDPHTRPITLINILTAKAFFFPFAVPVSLISLVQGLLKFGGFFERKAQVSCACFIVNTTINQTHQMLEQFAKSHSGEP